MAYLAPRKDVPGPLPGTMIPAAENDILVLLEKDTISGEDTKDLWNYLKSMSEEKGLIKLLEKKHITRMWEIAVDTDIGIADLRAPDDKVLKDLRAPDDKVLKDLRTKSDKAVYDKAVHDYAAAAFNDMLPPAGKSVKFIVKRKKEGGWDKLRFPWERSSKEFPFKEDFEMTISNGNNAYSVHIGGIGGDNSNEHQVAVDIPGEKPIFSVKLKVDHVPEAVKHCVAAFTFGDGSNTVANQIIVYIRFAGPTMLVGKAFKANWATKSEYKTLWGDLVLAKY